MHEQGAEIIGRANEVQHGKSVDGVGNVRLRFTIIDAMIGRRIQHNIGLQFHQRGMRSSMVCDVEVTSRQGVYVRVERKACWRSCPSCPLEPRSAIFISTCQLQQNDGLEGT